MKLGTCTLLSSLFVNITKLFRLIYLITIQKQHTTIQKHLITFEIDIYINYVFEDVKLNLNMTSCRVYEYLVHV